MMKIIVAILLFTAGSAQARLGETNVDVAKRYEAVQSREQLSTNEWRGVFRFKEYKIIVEFSNNVSVAEFVYPGRKFTEVESQALIESIGEGKWSKLPLLSEWINTDTKAAARVDRVAVGKDVLTVASRAYINKQAEQAAEQKRKEKAKADGF
jgi:hypothetical protein